MLEFLQSKPIAAVLSAGLGALLTILTQLVLRKRGLFSYSVSHARVGLSTDDVVFGKVRVTWNDNPVANLYASTLELRNESLRDYKDVVVRAFVHETNLLTERTEIVDTTLTLEWSSSFSKQLAVPVGSKPTPTQRELYAQQREYLIPTMNRNQVVRLSFLNAASPGKEPSLWLDIVHPGVRVKFRVMQKSFLGVPQLAAGLSGIALGLVFWAVIVSWVQPAWLAALLSLLYGFLAVLPGALAIKAWRWFRELVGS
jgi:hypothetical protein